MTTIWETDHVYPGYILAFNGPGATVSDAKRTTLFVAASAAKPLDDWFVRDLIAGLEMQGYQLKRDPESSLKFDWDEVEEEETSASVISLYPIRLADPE